MGANTAENTNRRLKAVLDVLAEGVWTDEKLNAGAVLGEAIARVPLNEFERELLSGGIPRGHKTLTTATAKLVKAGWLVKGRAGWTITEDGQRATVAFADPAAFAAALDAGTPVPADTPLPSAPAGEAGEGAKTAPLRRPPEGRPRCQGRRQGCQAGRRGRCSGRQGGPQAQGPPARPHSRRSSGREAAGRRGGAGRQRRDHRAAGSSRRCRRLQHPAGRARQLGPAVRRIPDGTGPGRPALEDRGGPPGRLPTASRSRSTAPGTRTSVRLVPSTAPTTRCTTPAASWSSTTTTGPATSSWRSHRRASVLPTRK